MVRLAEAKPSCARPPRAAAAAAADFRGLVAAGRSLALRGEYGRSLACYRRALRLGRGGAAARPSLADALEDVAAIQARAGDPARSIHAYHLCLEIRQQRSDGKGPGGGDPATGRTLYDLAGLYYSIGMAPEALDHLLQAQLLLGDRDDDDDDGLRAFDVWMAIGAVQRRLGRYDDSLSSFDEALRVLGRWRASCPGAAAAAAPSKRMMARSMGNNSTRGAASFGGFDRGGEDDDEEEDDDDGSEAGRAAAPVA
jgi:tetratricopeptide (TPR) repeat protein